ncbi:MAG: response regulator [Acidobacteria bacterium]|nr:response regulator [Acidobacteriota bacterium]
MADHAQAHPHPSPVQSVSLFSRLTAGWSISAKFSAVTAGLVLWVVTMVLAYDISSHPDRFEWTKAVVLLALVALSVGAIARFSVRLLVRPLSQLHEGLEAACAGRLNRIHVNRTGDEIESLGNSFNQMISALAASNSALAEYHKLLEEKIRQRTEQLEQALHTATAASQTKSEFLANMSHELRTPMSGVIGMLDLVLDSPLSTDQREQILTAHNCAHSLLALLNDLLDLSKIEAGRMALEEIPFDLRQMVADCAKAHQLKARAKGITLTWQVDDGVPRQILGDPLRIRQILNNLLSNAVKFTSEGYVRVSVSLQPGAGDTSRPHILRLVVSDTGPGIAQEKQETIFEKFTQADGSISRKFGGTGLGLAITRKLTEVHGGRILLDSKVGMGSSFTVLLPCGRVDNAAGENVHAAAPASSETPRILVVEDNRINQKVVVSLLRKKGYTADIANNGQEALDCLKLREYGLVLMDVQMPVLDGLEATHQIRADARFALLPIVAMTAHAMNGDRERCLQAGMNDYVAKPVDHKHLLSLVDHYLNHTLPRSAGAGEPSPAEQSVLTEELIQLFLQLSPQRLQALRQSCDAGNLASVRSEAGKLRTAAEEISAAGIVRCAAAVEDASASADLQRVQQSLLHLDEELSSFIRQAAPEAR